MTPPFQDFKLNPGSEKMGNVMPHILFGTWHGTVKCLAHGHTRTRQTFQHGASCLYHIVLERFLLLLYLIGQSQDTARLTHGTGGIGHLP
jgi:hypothetical protein